MNFGTVKRTDYADKRRIEDFLKDKIIPRGERGGLKAVEYAAGFNDQKVANGLGYHTRSIAAVRRGVFGLLDFELAREGAFDTALAGNDEKSDARMANLETLVASHSATIKRQRATIDDLETRVKSLESLLDQRTAPRLVAV